MITEASTLFIFDFVSPKGLLFYLQMLLETHKPVPDRPHEGTQRETGLARQIP